MSNQRGTKGPAMDPIEDNGWEINADKSLIAHQSGFKAEFRDASIYSILNFPYEATIHDIRNWVKKAEHLLMRLRPGEPDT
ncbi:MAG: hypothetical protein KZQ73_10520 [Candidatus Thiodiazotropha sp. (ex Semelilucina semeliformis)]|nr:hypothetical protein [Candidatus Thiodiazotropha sp. (ex Myrtea spinifera)]MCU7808285.1 hypothetical protein [Candidatus Thiodiazotropha sp. (ex Semelilucina semeliformis)]MCU7827554.1 hypothetical protein [Candidatus Thiodiazotropha sp. (ex Myrtea sp. 'scaly one' KF741663)]